MDRPAGLKLALLAVLVSAGHVLGLEWLARQADAISGLKAMVPPMYTRLLKPATPPKVVAVARPAPLPQPRVRAAPRPKPPASSAEERAKRRQQEQALEEARRKQQAQALEEAKRQQEQADEEARRRQQAQADEEARKLAEAPPAAMAPEPSGQVVAKAPLPAASAPLAAASAASAPTAAASAAAAEASAHATASLDHWPTDTRLTYQLGGEWRSGPLFGDARVQWQREGDRYQVRLDVKIQVFGTQVLTSQGEVTPDGLVPREYEELRPGKRRSARFGDEVLVLENGKTLPRPPGVQDTASQFVELAQRFSTGKEVLEVGRTVTVWLARPGGLDQWTYEVVGREMLRTPSLGEVEAFHLKPRAIANPRGNITAEMWFAPSLQYLPVRIKVIMGTEAYLDLLVDRIEQR